MNTEQKLAEALQCYIDHYRGDEGMLSPKRYAQIFSEALAAYEQAKAQPATGIKSPNGWLCSGPTRAEVNAWMADAGWQNSSMRQADLDKVCRVVAVAVAAERERWAAICKDHGIKEQSK